MSGWISVDERLPEHGVDVWVWWPRCVEPHISAYHEVTYPDVGTMKWWNDFDPVTHWQPLERPAPPVDVDYGERNPLEVGC